MDQDSMSFILSQSLLKSMPIESMMLSDQLILFCTLHLLPSIFLSTRVFPNELALCISFSFSNSPSNEYAQLISFRNDWLISFQYKGLSSIFSRSNLKVSVLCCSVFTMVQLSHLYITVKIIALTIRKSSAVAQSCPSFATIWTAGHQASLSVTNS